CWVCSAVTGRFWISIIWDTILAVSRPDARPVTWSGAPLADDVVLMVGELLETEEVDISKLVSAEAPDGRMGSTPHMRWSAGRACRGRLAPQPDAGRAGHQRSHHEH